MPTAPKSAFGARPQVSEDDLLMAAATMHEQGRLVDPEWNEETLRHALDKSPGGVVRFDPEFPPIKKMLENGMPEDIERVDDGGGSTFRYKKVPTS